MEKRMMAVLLAFCLLCGNMEAVSAASSSSSAATSTATTSTVSTAQLIITTIGIMTADSSGNMNLSKNVTRAQFAKMLVNASTLKSKISKTSKVSLYKDVPYTHSYAAYIRTAVEQGWMSGYLNGTFKPNQAVTLEEAVAAVVTMLGYTTADFGGSVSEGQMNLYQSLSLNKKITVTKNTSKMNRKNCMYLFYNLLLTKNKTGDIYAKTLDYPLTESNEIDYLALMSDKMKGPVIAKEAWESQIPFSMDGAAIYRNGAATVKSSVSTYDVLYYNKTLKTLWAYSTKITGTIEAVSPSALSPTSVTVAGNSYNLGTQKICYEFSNLGSYQSGTAVTLLLGKDGEVEGMLNPNDLNVTIYGLVTETGTGVVDSDSKEVKVGNYVKIIGSDGVERTYDSDKDNLSAYDLVQVNYIDGKPTISKLEKKTLSGAVSADGKTFYNYRFADDVNILDYNNHASMKIYPSRLAGATLYTSDVFFYALNEKGEISDLILNNFTGDLYSYGMITAAVESSNGGYSGSYDYMIGDQKASYKTSQFIFNVASGPAQIGLNGTECYGMKNLTSLTVSSINGLTVQGNNGSNNSGLFTMADQVSVYLYQTKENNPNSGQYYATTLSKVSDLDTYSLKAYYDKPMAYGGRVRVIVATKKTS